ncbi:YaaL family protein [Haloimpatiens sp. FM7330]|uniref:YaaL family protein n=1 Tax=Haloimpatiens sp. FM7330 TaxID=3298610 RepID=UPI003627C6DB
MNRRKVLNNLFRNVKYTKEERELLESIEDARYEWQIAREYFQQVDDSKLVDYAIYKEEAAKARYVYLLNQAKVKNIKVNTCFMIEDIDAV